MGMLNCPGTDKPVCTKVKPSKNWRIIMSKPRLYEISAFYKNDKPGGLGFTIRNFDPEFGDNLIKYIGSYENDWKSAKKKEHDKIIEFYFSQLDQIATAIAGGWEKEVTAKGYEILAIANICFLENHGFIRTDEYNGCIFLYESEIQKNLNLITVTEPSAPEIGSRSSKNINRIRKNEQRGGKSKRAG
jgi:hypothetical protein